LQLLYLNDFDHFVKEKLKIKHYLRYMDDMIMIVRTKEEAEALKAKCKVELEKIGLELNPKS